jgi:F-type H+-transporting ATPase subunit b
MELSEQLIEKNIDEGKNKELIDEFISKVGD